MSDSFTVRIDESSRVSRDDGATALLPSVLVDELCRHIRGASSQLDWVFGSPSAAAVAGLAEARANLPREAAISSVVPVERLSGIRVHLPSAGQSSGSFGGVLEARRSWRNLGPLSLGELAATLVPTARIRAWQTGSDGYQLTHRAVPSAGARHPSDLLVAAESVDGLERGWWFFDELTCELVANGDGMPPIGQVVARIAELGTLKREPGAVIFLVTHFQRTLSRYPAGATLVWRDVGVLLGVLHLAATAAGLGSCIVGSTGLVLASSEPRLMADTGALALGRVVP